MTPQRMKFVVWSLVPFLLYLVGAVVTALFFGAPWKRAGYAAIALALVYGTSLMQKKLPPEDTPTKLDL